MKSLEKESRSRLNTLVMKNTENNKNERKNNCRKS